MRGGGWPARPAGRPSCHIPFYPFDGREKREREKEEKKKKRNRGTRNRGTEEPEPRNRVSVVNA
jgi:hypothetical protein